MLDGFDRSATAVCSVGYCEPNSKPTVFTGKVTGRIVMPRGKSGFGWDSIFEVEGKTFAELGEKKHALSHRFKAIKKFSDFLSAKNSD